VETFSDIIFS